MDPLWCRQWLRSISFPASSYSHSSFQRPRRWHRSASSQTAFGASYTARGRSRFRLGAPFGCALAGVAKSRFSHNRCDGREGIIGKRNSRHPRFDPSVPTGPAVDIVSANPLILVIDGLCSTERTAELRRILEQQNINDLTQTDAYVDDMFEEGRTIDENANFLGCVAHSGVRVPPAYQSDPLRSFLWVAATHWHTLPKDAFLRARLAIARRAWQTQWNPEDIVKSGFKKAATRWKVPEAMLRCLAPIVVDVLGTRVQGIPGTADLCTFPQSNMSWVLRDSTVVRYRGGESQVPHMDTCDMTILVYLESFGGETCFPNINQRIQPSAGRVLLFFSTIPEATRFGGFADSAYGRPNEATIHYGGLSDPDELGEKLVVQLLLSAVDMGSTTSWRDVLQGNAFRNAAFSHCKQSAPLDSKRGWNTGTGACPKLALSAQQCASMCRDNALDLETQSGGPKHCIWCWNKWLEKAISEDSSKHQ